MTKMKMQKIDIPYYDDHTRVSNSNIGVFIKSGIRAFKKMFDGQDEKTVKKYYETGTMVHMFILQPEEFWDNYIILDFDMPKSEQQKKFAKDLINSLEFEEDKRIINAYKANYVSSENDEKILAKGKDLALKLKDYIEFLKAENNNKKVISYADYNMLTTIKENIKSHKKANDLIYNLPSTTESYNEFHINWVYPKKYEDFELLCKSLVDRLLIDHEKKIITLVDLKTSFDISNFSGHIKKLDYTRQLAYYWIAIHWYFLNVLEIDPEEYQKETYIIALQTTKDFNVSVVKFTDKQLEKDIDKINFVISELCWHFKNNAFEHDREYYEGDGALTFDDIQIELIDDIKDEGEGL